jgi:hypothetical protein
MSRGWRGLHSRGRHPAGVRGVIRRTDMVGRVVGGDSRGGWTRLRAKSLRPLLSLSSPTEERERERESLVYILFFPRSTPQREQQNGKVSGVVAIFLVSAYVLIVYATTMNISFSLLAYSCVQSENERKTEQYSARESAVVEVDPTFYIRIDYSYKRLRDTIYRSNCVAKTSRLEWTHLS